MAGKNWQAGGRNSIPALALVCLLATASSCGLAWAAPPVSGGFAPSSYVGELDPNKIWELLIGGIVVAIQRALGVPVKLVGLGEGPDDLAPFEPAAFVDALLG